VKKAKTEEKEKGKEKEKEKEKAAPQKKTGMALSQRRKGATILEN